jgi:uncharacterized protein (DUF169 family)
MLEHGTDMLEQISNLLRTRLDLPDEPVAMAFADSAPPGVKVLDHEVPSACTLWRLGASETFYAPASSHYNCSIGAMTMGFELPESVSSDLAETVTLMSGAGYLDAGEPPNIPVISEPHQGIVYGPLATFPVDADLVLLWLSPKQAMLLAEATGSVKWTSDAPTQVYGRPACTALPVALKGGHPTVSFGCAGMRTFTSVSDDRLLGVIPGADLERFTQALVETVSANQTMGAVYEDRKASIPAR